MGSRHSAQMSTAHARALGATMEREEDLRKLAAAMTSPPREERPSQNKAPDRSYN